MKKFFLRYAFFLSFFASTFFMTQLSLAATNTFDGIMCNAYNLFNGQWGRIFALFALVALGISFFLGKISWGTVLSVAIGIALIFGGSAIVNTISGGTSCATA